MIAFEEMVDIVQSGATEDLPSERLERLESVVDQLKTGLEEYSFHKSTILVSKNLPKSIHRKLKSKKTELALYLSGSLTMTEQVSSNQQGESLD